MIEKRAFRLFRLRRALPLLDRRPRSRHHAQEGTRGSLLSRNMKEPAEARNLGRVWWKELGLGCCLTRSAP